MSLSYTILDPALDLFLYDLRDSFGQSEAAIAENRRQFWRRIYGDEKTIEAILSAQRSKEDELSDYVQLIDPYPHIQKLAPPLDNGYYYPVKLGDTYGLQIDCSGKLNDPQWEKISQLQQLEDLATEIRSRCGEKWGTVGQSWLFVGQLDRHNPGVDAVAKDCYEGLKLTKTPNWKRDLKGKGRLCGATLYELEKPDTTPDGKNHHFHAIVCLFDFDYPDDKRQDEIQYLYRDLMRLLHFRHKILWIYEQTRLIKHDSKQLGYDIQKRVDRLPLSPQQTEVDVFPRLGPIQSGQLVPQLDALVQRLPPRLPEHFRERGVGEQDQADREVPIDVIVRQQPKPMERVGIEFLRVLDHEIQATARLFALVVGVQPINQAVRVQRIGRFSETDGPVGAPEHLDVALRRRGHVDVGHVLFGVERRHQLQGQQRLACAEVAGQQDERLTDAECLAEERPGAAMH